MTMADRNRLHDIVEVELTVGQVLSLARLTRAAQRRKMLDVDPDFMPDEGKRDANVESVRRYGILLKLLLEAARVDELDVR